MKITNCVTLNPPPLSLSLSLAHLHQHSITITMTAIIIAMTTITPAVAPISLEQLHGYLAKSRAEQDPDNV